MTNEKQMANLTKSLSLLTMVLTLSLILGSPCSNTTANQVAKLTPSVEAQRIESVENQSIAAESNAEATENVHKDIEIPVISSESEIQVISSGAPEPDYLCMNANRGGSADRNELDVLIHLINAEAYGLSYKAKVAVGQVVMNRWTGPYYGDDLLAIMTAPYQFTPIYDGSAYEKEIESDSIKAANAVLNGTGVEELTDDTYYFVDPEFTEDKTIEQKMAFVCEIEGIHFYKPPAK